MITLKDFSKFNFQHLTTKEFFELEKLIAALLRERDAALAAQGASSDTTVCDHEWRYDYANHDRSYCKKCFQSIETGNE